MMRVHPSIRRSILALATIGLLSACGSEPESADGGGNGRVVYLDKASIPEDPAEQVFQQVCLSCHATGVGPVITGRNLPPEAVKLFVRNGSRAMPAFTESMIDDQMLDQVAQLVATSEAPPSQTVE